MSEDRAALPVRVLLVDDSATSRATLGRLISSGVGLLIVGQAGSGEEAVRSVARLKPDIVLMDIVMQGMDGLTATRRIMTESPVPVLIVSGASGHDSDLHFQALTAGAIDFVRKPSRAELDDPLFCARFCRAVRALARVPVVTRTRRLGGPADPVAPALVEGARRSFTPPPHPAVRGYARVCIGASTGGPPAINALLKTLRPRPPWPVLIVQHIASGFSESLAAWLAHEAGLEVVVATSGVFPSPGVVYIAPDGVNLLLEGGALRLSPDPTSSFHRPSVDSLFFSIVTGGLSTSTIGVLLTGMGYDGAAGLHAIRTAGGFTIAEDESTAVVYGMPKAAIDRAAATEVLPLPDIGPRLLALGAAPLRAPGS